MRTSVYHFLVSRHVDDVVFRNILVSSDHIGKGDASFSTAIRQVLFDTLECLDPINFDEFWDLRGIFMILLNESHLLYRSHTGERDVLR